MINTEKLSDAFSQIRNGKSIKQSSEATGIPITRIETIAEKFVDPNRLGYADIEQENLKQYENYLLKNGDILMSHINSPKHLGKTAVYRNEPEFLIHGMNLLSLRVNRKICDSVYANYYFQSPYFRQDLLKISNKSVNQASFSVGRLKDLTIPLPPIKTQQRIASILDDAAALRDKTKDLLTEYDLLAQSIFLEMFGDPIINPKGWNTSNIEKVCINILGGGTPKRSNEKYFTGDIPWVTPKDMKRLYINDSKIKITAKAVKESSARLVPKNAVLMVIRSGILKKKLPVAISTSEITLNQDMKAFISNETILNPKYLMFFFLNAQNYLLGKVRAVTADNIEFSQIKKMEIPIPSLKFQNQFADKITLIEKQKALAKQELQESEDLFNCLLQKAFKGEL